MGKRGRSRRKLQAGDELRAPSSDYSDEDGNVLTLRGSLTPAARREYAELRAGHGGAGRPAATQEDAWQRAVELLFERLTVRWMIAGAPIERQRELLTRFRAASAAERAWVRETIRAHCAEHFPDVQAP
ncbi:MAG TPA: hypothetical protein VGX69_10510 [Solirubrobacteraceae bacterium]|nr:hypothetical protein [Solirubrobacteraceae bacterium]